MIPEFASAISDRFKHQSFVRGSFVELLFRISTRDDAAEILGEIPNRFWASLSETDLDLKILMPDGGYPAVALDRFGQVNQLSKVDSGEATFVRVLLHTAIRNLRSFNPVIEPISAPHLVSLEILSFNSWGVPAWLGSRAPRRFAEIGRQFAASTFDVIGLQEMFDRRTKTILERANFPFQAFGGKYPGLRDASGVVTLSRYPIKHTSFHPFKDRTLAERVVKKGILRTTISSPIGEIEVLNVHLCSDSDRSMSKVAEIRIRQITEIANLVETFGTHRPVFILGDFNVTDGHIDSDALTKISDYDCFELTNRNVPGDKLLPFATYDFDRNSWAAKYKNVGVHCESSRLDRILFKGRLKKHVMVETDLCFTEPTLGKKIHLSDHFGVRTRLLSFK